MTADFPALKQQCTSYAQSLRLWVLDLLVWLAAMTRSRSVRVIVRQELRFLRAEVRRVLLYRMALDICANRPKRGKRRAHERERSVHRRRFHRHVLRGARLHTFDDAKRVLVRLEAHVARCVANFRQGMKERAPRSVGGHAHACADADEAVRAPDSS